MGSRQAAGADSVDHTRYMESLCPWRQKGAALLPPSMDAGERTATPSLGQQGGTQIELCALFFERTSEFCGLGEAFLVEFVLQWR